MMFCLDRSHWEVTEPLSLGLSLPKSGFCFFLVSADMCLCVHEADHTFPTVDDPPALLQRPVTLQIPRLNLTCPSLVSVAADKALTESSLKGRGVYLVYAFLSQCISTGSQRQWVEPVWLPRSYI